MGELNRRMNILVIPMNRQLLLLRIISCLLILGTSNGLAAGDMQAAKSIRPYQLRGLRSVSFFAIVGTEISNNYEIGDKIEQIASKLLTKAGLTISDKEDSALVTLVSSYPIEVEALSEYVLIEVSTELNEGVRLLRKPSPRTAVNGITWHRRFVDVIPSADIESHILRIAEYQLNSFVVDLNTASIK